MLNLTLNVNFHSKQLFSNVVKKKEGKNTNSKKGVNISTCGHCIYPVLYRPELLINTGQRLFYHQFFGSETQVFFLGEMKREDLLQQADPDGREKSGSEISPK